ncbi:MAG: hypothetical protein H5U16_08795 [Roseovarius sp.]|nr:hypothetical protein [Roseovarius sp.]
MTRFGTIALAAVLAVTSTAAVAAPGSVVRQGNETALELANRIGACGSAGIAGANYAEGGTVLQVQCAGAAGGDLSGGLGTGGAVAAGVVSVALIAAAASGGGSSSSTTSTSGTN